MEELNLNSFTASSTLDFSNLLINIAGVLLLTFLVKIHYRHYFPPLSKSQSMETTFVAIGLVTFLVISVVKSSLALSLGLVGALSIIRFRTPIKEPLELAYLFMVIAIGLGFGADQKITTVTATIVLLIAMVFLMRNKERHNTEMHFIYMTISNNVSTNSLKDMLSSLGEETDHDIILRRLDRSENSTQITMCAVLTNTDQITSITEKLNNLFSPTSLSIVDGQKLMPF